MDEFCGTPFWDWELTWNNTDLPDFTPCFQNTVLAWIPPLFLVLFGSMDIYYSINSRAKNIPWSALNVAKTVMLAVLTILEIVLLYGALASYNADPGGEQAVYDVEIYTPIIKGSFYIVAILLLLFSKAKWIRSSGVQFVHAFLLFSCEAFRFRTMISSRNAEIPPEVTRYVIEIVYFPITVALLFLNCWADVKPTYQQDTRIADKPCPEASSSYINRILFHWYGGMVYTGYRKPLEYSDLWDLNPEDRSRSLVPIFDKYWSRDLNKAAKTRIQESSLSYGKSNGSVDVKFKRIKSSDKRSEKEYTSIMPAIVKSFGSTFFFGSFLKIIPDILAFASPQLLNLLIVYVNEGGDQLWKGILFAALMFLTAFFQTLVTAQYSHRMYLTGMRIRTTLISAVYRKALLVSNAAKRESTVGEIVNLMSADVQRIMDLVPFINMIWSCPFQIGVALYFLWGILGPSSLAGLVVMVLLLPANAIIANIAKKLQMVQMKNKDNRVKLMNEILSGVKVLKLYAWEPSFEDQIMSIREKEMKVLRQAAYLSAVTNFLWTCAPFLVAISSFAAYVLSDPGNVLDAQKAFVALSLFNIMSLPLTFLPMIIVFCVQAVVSINRLNKYMNAEEIDPDAVGHDASEDDPILIENGSFSWEPETVVLKNINLKIKEGSIVAIVGTVGSGKSSLLSSMLGELEKTNGRVNTKGTIGYVAQQAWIQNATLRDNILFGRHYDSYKYDKIVDACALKPDLEILPAGDKTEIGEKGINLSGGQKQRVSLARSAYNNADVYLFDDPLSAVDSHVGKHIFEKVIGPKGLLKRKTRVLVTHGISFLPQMDNIIVMKDGEISESGTYQELLDKKGAFAEFLTQRISSVEDIEEIGDVDVIQGLEQVVGPLEHIRKRHKSEAASESEGGETSKLRSLRMDSPSQEISSDRRRLSSSASRRSSKALSESISLAKDKLIGTEKAETESVKFAVYLDYFRAAGWALSIWTFMLYFIFQAFSVGSNLWLSVWSNEPVVNGTQDASKRDVYLGVYAAFSILQGGGIMLYVLISVNKAVAILAATIVMALGTLKSAAVLHYKMLSRILKAPMWFFDTTPVGRIVNRFAKDVDTADNTLPFNMRLWLNSFFQVFSTLAVISYSTPIFIAVIIPISVVYYFVQRFYVATSRQLKRLESVTRSPIYSHFGETIQGASTIRAYGQQDRFILESEAKVDHNQISYFPAITSNRWLAVRLETVGNAIIFFAALFAVLGKDTLSPGMVGLSVSYALQITIALNMLVRWTSDVETNIVAVERLKEYGEAPQEAQWRNEERQPGKNWPEKGAVTFDHYQTRYRPGLDLVLSNVTCKIEPEEKIGIVGRTGAGKSSLTLALFRIIEPAGGSIVIDGHDISKLGLHDLRGRITIIPQDPVLFSGTLRLNLDPFETHSDEEIWRSLELGHLKTFAQGLAQGLMHEIAEGGENLSVGQRQLVCLARALLRKTKILVLDEATAAVDLETDDLIQATIRKEFKDATVITIAHRLNTIMDSTRIIVLDKGEIREFDTPEELLKKRNSIFYGMAKDAGIVH